MSPLCVSLTEKEITYGISKASKSLLKLEAQVKISRIWITFTFQI